MIDIDLIDADDEIKNSLRSLSSKINFEVEETKGANGHLFFGTNTFLGKRVAIKYYYWGEDRETYAEPKQLSDLSSEYIVEILDAGPVDENWAYFITEYCVNGDLESAIVRNDIGNTLAIDWTSQLLSGLIYLHAKNYLHRDIKLSNVFLNGDNVVQIGDFGSIICIPNGSKEIPASNQTLMYRPPETITDKVYSQVSDVYQVGVVLYLLLGGSLSITQTDYLSAKQLREYNEIGDIVDRQLFAEQCIGELIAKGKFLDYSSLPPWVSNRIKQLIKKATNKDRNKRYKTASEFLAALHDLKHRNIMWDFDEDGLLSTAGYKKFSVVECGDNFRVKKKLKMAGSLTIPFRWGLFKKSSRKWKTGFPNCQQRIT
ncbi:MAG: protein kinase [Rhodospirillales bacterium]|nr:protein kinase [Rhodospirillales bacterium]